MKLRSILPLLALTMVSAQAADFKVGVHGGFSLPQGKVGNSDNLDGKMGFTLGGNLQFDLGKGHAITPRLDVTAYSKNKSEDGHSFDYNVTNTTLGADYNYFVDGKVGQGFYLIGGLGFAQVKFEAKWGPLSVSTTPKAFQLALGAGYQFNTNLHTDLRYTSVDVEPDFGGGDKEKITCPAINVTVGYRF